MVDRFRFRVWHQLSEPPEYIYSDSYGHMRSFWDEVEDECPEILEQCTGLKDKNGKLIFEGDILNYGRLALNDDDKFDWPAWKRLPKGMAGDQISTVWHTYAVTSGFTLLAELQRRIEENPDVVAVEIIGNIHENPELLTEKEKGQKDE